MRSWGLSAAEQDEVWVRWRRGESQRLIARRLDKRGTSVRALVLQTGGVQQHPPRRSVRYLSMAEREEISRGVAAGEPCRQIAARCTQLRLPTGSRRAVRCCQPSRECRQLALELLGLLWSAWLRPLALCVPSPGCLLLLGSLQLPGCAMTVSGSYGQRRSRTDERRTGGERPATKRYQPTHNNTRRQGQRHDRSIAAGHETAVLVHTAEVTESCSLSTPCSGLIWQDRTSVSPSRSGGRHCADLPKQAQSVPVDPLFNELTVDNSAEKLSIHIDGLAGGSGAFKRPAVGTAQ